MIKDIKNAKGQLIGQERTESNGNITLYSAGGKLLGTWNESSKNVFKNGTTRIGSDKSLLYTLLNG